VTKLEPVVLSTASNITDENACKLQEIVIELG
jgi:hypothetical protein